MAQVFDEDFLISLLSARRIVVFTGAGMSAESGIPTFRDAQTGLWEQYDPHVLASIEGYLKNKALVWGWYEWRRRQVLTTKPHAGHIAVAQLAGYVERLTVITQNVDDLHERAGSRGVIHLHGSLHHPRCFNCSIPFELPPDTENAMPACAPIETPRCKYCNGPIRPGVVWFGEMLPEQAWAEAKEAALNCDVLFSVGTSSLVWPAAKLPDMALIRGAKIVQINPESTPLDQKAHYNFRSKAGEVLPRLIQALSAFLG